MNSPYTFDNLKLITGGDPKLDIEILNTFLTTSRQYIDDMRLADEANDSQAWIHESHALKGACFSIGVEKLGQMCQDAQSLGEASSTLRLEALRGIENEFTIVEKMIFDMIKEKKAKIQNAN